MSDILGKVTVIFLIVLLIFGVPVLNIALKNDNTTQADVTNAVQEFVNKSCATGYISANNYRDLMNVLDRTDNLYDVAIEHYAEQFNPDAVYEVDSDGNDVLDADGNKIISCYIYTRNHMLHTKDEIIEQLFEDYSGSYLNAMTSYKMNTGDYLKVTIVSKKPTLGHLILGVFTGKNKTGTINVNFGGYIGSTAR